MKHAVRSIKAGSGDYVDVELDDGTVFQVTGMQAAASGLDLATAASQSRLVEHALRELRLFNAATPPEDQVVVERDRPYDPDRDDSDAMQLIRLFASQGHSGGSAPGTIKLFAHLAMFGVLTPLTAAPEEWNSIGAQMGGSDLWQSTRDSSCFSTDAGRTYYDIDEVATGVITLQTPSGGRPTHTSVPVAGADAAAHAIGGMPAVEAGVVAGVEQEP
jgi:hypothetical protein